MKLYVDGGCKPNPGEKAIAVLAEDGTVLLSKRIGYGTNNEAEYEAVIQGLKIAKDYNVADVIIYTDSMLVLNQLKRVWKHKEKFDKFIKEIEEILKTIRILTLLYIKSKDNPAHEEVKRLLESGEEEGKSVKLEVGQMTAPISVPVFSSKNYKAKGKENFTIFVEYKNKQLAVWVDPADADTSLIKGVMRIALLELEGVDTEKIHNEVVKALKKEEKKRKQYTM